MTSYLIVNFTVTNPEKYNNYFAQARESLKPYIQKGQVKMLVYAVGKAKGTKEGNPYDRIMILEFQSGELANEWYNSDTYQKLIPLRHASTSDS